MRPSSTSLFIALSVLVLLTACALPAEDQAPKTNAESEQLTLEATGALIAPQPVSERVVTELELIRTGYPAVAGIKALPRWHLQKLLIGFDGPGWTAVQGGTYTAWDTLNSSYGVTNIDSSFLAPSKVVVLTFAVPYNMPLLAPEYAKLPNVLYAEPNGIVGDGSDVCLSIDGDSHFFIFDAASGDCPAGCTQHTYWGFVVTPNSEITKLGTWDDSTVSVEPAWLSDPPAPACTKWLGYGRTFGTSGVLSGTVMFWGGDFMPGNPTGTKTPAVREVYVYEPTSFFAVTNAHEFFDGFYSDIRANLAAVVTSNTDGRFSLRLPAGRYSLFVMEDGLYYANLSDLVTINPVTVTTRATTTVDFDITYQATF
jgi:hypothetical protein